MGKEIEQAALGRGHSIAWKMGRQDRDRYPDADLRQADVIIEFTTPQAAPANIRSCFRAGVPVVVGTTGWYEHLADLRELCHSGKHSLIYGSNFSLGVNIFFAISRKLARIMNQYPVYDPSITEIHHTQKLDAPSGTAITLAQGMLQEIDRKLAWVKGEAARPEELPVYSIREDQVPGTHTVRYASPIDTIEMTHTAHNRQGFALGAVLGAEWLLGKTGCFEVSDMFRFDD